MNITDFLKTGSYLGLKIGLSEKEIYQNIGKKALGKRQYYSKENKEDGFSYFYDAMEIMIVNSIVQSISFDIERSCVIILNDIYVAQYTSFEAILRYLDIANISWSFEQKYCEKRNLSIRTEGGVIFSCFYDKGEYRLSKFTI